MLSREERILSELIVSRGLVARESIEECAGNRDLSDPDVSLVDALVERGYLDRDHGDEVAAEACSLDRALAPEIPAAGRLGEFRLIREIGRGGMGIVYEAEQQSLERRVALKILPAGGALDERLVIRFLREARTAARLRHPGIVQIITSGSAEGLLYFAMELVEGHPLDDVIASGPLSPERAATIAAEVADALAHAHEAGLVHRDVKPGNLLIDETGRVKITDFGLVQESTGPRATLSQHVLGTPSYMSPEQASGERVDPRSDIYGLGAVLYAMLAGRPPYEGQVPAVVLGRLVSGPPPSLESARRDIPSDLVSRSP